MSYNPQTWTSVVVTATDLNREIRDMLLKFLGPYAYFVDGLSLQSDLTNGCDVPNAQTLTAGQPLLMGAGFSGTADQFAQFKWALPKEWNAGTITYRVRWSSPTAGAGSVVFSLAGSASSDGDAINQAFGTAQTITDAFTSTNKEHITSASGALTIGNSPAKEDTIYFRFGRLATNGSDTKVEKIYVTSVELFLTMDDVNDA